MRKIGRELAAAPSLRTMGGSNYAQFRDGVHANRANVRTKTNNVGGENNHFVGRDGLERQDK